MDIALLHDTNLRACDHKPMRETMMLTRLLITAALTMAPTQLIAANCNAQPESPVCSKGQACSGPTVVEGGNNMSFSSEGSAITICEAVMCMDGKVHFRKLTGTVEFVSGKVRNTNVETNRPEGPAYPISAMIDRNNGIAHVAWGERGIMMQCRI